MEQIPRTVLLWYLGGRYLILIGGTIKVLSLIKLKSDYHP